MQAQSDTLRDERGRLPSLLWRSARSAPPAIFVAAGAILAALPTLIVYIVSGRYFVRGLMSGAVKG